jgi:hypothetical protein
MNNVRQNVKIVSQIQPIWKKWWTKLHFVLRRYIRILKRRFFFNEPLMSSVSQYKEQNGFWTRTVKQTWHWFPRHAGTKHSFWWKVQARRVLFLLQAVELKFQALQRSQNYVRALCKTDKMDKAWVRPNSLSGCPSACINIKSKW